MGQLSASKQHEQERLQRREQQRQLLGKQQEELVAAAKQMASMAEKIKRHMEADAVAKAQRESLRVADEEAQEKLRSLNK